MLSERSQTQKDTFHMGFHLHKMSRTDKERQKGDERFPQLGGAGMGSDY